MTLAELTRAIESKKRMQRLQAQEKAAADYILADLIGRSIARIHSAAASMPDISEVYPALFSNEQMQEAKQTRKDELSALRFTQFANAFNAQFKEEAQKNE